MDCLFCKIVKGEIPCYKIYEDDFVLAFLDISCDSVGHTLVVPKTHATNILDADKKQVEKVFAAVQKISKHYTEICGFDGVKIINNNGECAGQSVMHLHVHIVPRKNGDKAYSDLNPVSKNMNLAEIAEKLNLGDL